MKQRNEVYESPINEVIEDVVDLGQQLGIENLNAEDVIESLQFDSQDLSNEDLFELREQEKTDDDGNDTGGVK